MKKGILKMNSFPLRPDDPIDPPPQPFRTVPSLPQGFVPAGKPLMPDGSLSLNNVVRALSTGVPIIGGLFNEMDAATNATLTPYVQPFLPEKDRDLPEENWSDRYRHALAIQEGMDRAFEKEHPRTNTGLNIAGGVVGTAPAILLAPEAFGAAGLGLLADSLIASTAGGLIGAADSAVRSGGDPAATWNGAGSGAFGGILGPTMGKMAGPIARYVGDKLLTSKAAKIAEMVPQAFTLLRRAVRDDGLDPALIEKGFAEMGPHATFADLGQNLGAQTAALAAIAGRPQQIVKSALAERQAGATGRINAAIDENFGNAPIRSELNAAEQRAFDRGRTVLDRDRTAPTPQELAKELQEGALPHAGQIGPGTTSFRLSQGTVDELKRIVGTKGDDIAELNRLIKGGDWNRARLSSVFGEERADRLFRTLENERIFADTAKSSDRAIKEGGRSCCTKRIG
ncbi:MULTISPECIES: hypothetical protein [unclassified Sinorhizobium]|uniref:hypothetical protein n=1 Tax=unclassified Sinorhizobium TaxID=2613772 RepID=UPI0035231E99